MANEPQNSNNQKPVVEKDDPSELSAARPEENPACEENPLLSPEASVPAAEGQSSMLPPALAPDDESLNVDLQDNFVETKEPSELMFCVILSSIYAGLARYCWTPLEQSGLWNIFVNIEGFFITIALLALLLGLRPYMSPSSLQISKHGLKYRGPYWPQRKTVNWSQVVQMYVSPELILVIYRLPSKPKSIRPLLVHSVYLADKDKVADSILKYSPIEPILVANPGIVTRTVQFVLFGLVVIWIANILKG